MIDIKNIVANRLMAKGAFQTGSFKLKLHETKPDAPLSPFYFNLRNKNNPKPGPLSDYDYTLMARCLLDSIDREIAFDAIAGIPRAGEPFVEGIRQIHDPKNDRKFRIIQLDKIETPKGRCIVPKAGFDYQVGEKVLLVDDLITAGDTKLEAIRAVESQGMVVAGLAVFLDRKQGGRKMIEDAGYNFFSVFGLDDLLDYYLGAGMITREKYDEIARYALSN